VSKKIEKPRKPNREKNQLKFKKTGHFDFISLKPKKPNQTKPKPKKPGKNRAKQEKNRAKTEKPEPNQKKPSKTGFCR